MNRFDALKRWTWSIFVTSLLAFALAGCEGDDGAPGADGTDGADGLSCWDLNENGEKDFPDEDTNGDGEINVDDCRDIGGPPPVASAIESCGTCHGDNAIASAAEVHALPQIEAVSNISFATVNGGADLAVTFDLAADGAPATGYDTARRAYFNNGGTRTDLRDFATLTDNGGGNYTITVAGAGPEAANNNRWLFQVVAGDDRETRAYFYADFPASPFAADVSPVAFSAEACAACHGPEGIQVHGGGFAAVDGGEPCLVCHGSDESDDPEVVPPLFAVAHAYHSGIWEEFDNEGNFVGFEEVTYPTYMNNCSVCHSEEAQLTAANSMPFTGEGCFSCHGSVEGIPFPDDATANLHSSVTEATDCQQCHSASGLAPDYQVVADSHNGATTERSGVIWDGVDTSVTEGALIEWLITDVADDGTNLTITWEASYDGTGVDPCNATAGAGAPVFFADDDGNLSILRNYAQGEDFILGTNPDGAGQPGGDVDVDATNTTCAGNVATTVVPVEETEAMYGRVAIQGKPRLPSPDPDDEDGLMQVRAKTPTYDWVVGTGGAAPERRAVVDTGLCLNCHVGSLYQHGGNRVDNVDMCILCHNVAANDEYVRVDNFGGVDASESYDGRAGQAFGIKELAHGIHPAGATGNPIVIYRGRGIYAWATDESQLQNWPTEDNCTRTNGSPGRTVVGSDPATATSDTCQPHNFHAPTYPRGLYDCAACHVEDVALLPDPTKAMATTVEAGEPPFGDQLNDVLQGVQTTSCVTCHADSAAKGHAYQNGWTPQAFPEGRQTIIDAN
jgi:OmcA/MtrC family decaheme c-type cytochrome